MTVEHGKLVQSHFLCFSISLDRVLFRDRCAASMKSASQTSVARNSLVVGNVVSVSNAMWMMTAKQIVVIRASA
jgi:hypothetical protein